MKIRFSTNTVALVAGVHEHFGAGVHDVPDDCAEKLVAAGDAEYADDEGGGALPRPTAAQLAAAEAADAQRAAEEAKAKAEAEAKAKAEAEAQAAQTGKKGGGKK